MVEQIERPGAIADSGPARGGWWKDGAESDRLQSVCEDIQPEWCRHRRQRFCDAIRLRRRQWTSPSQTKRNQHKSIRK